MTDAVYDETCDRCGDDYVLRSGEDPTEFCDACAHEVIGEVRADLAAAEARTLAAEKERDEWAERHKAQRLAVVESNDARAAALSRAAELTEALAALQEMTVAWVDYDGVEHDEDDCPEDDTCECPNVAKVNAVLAWAARALLSPRPVENKP